jgi:hypothetical protein
VTAAHGHDAFLMPDPHYHAILRSYLNNIPVENIQVDNIKAGSVA